MSLFLITFLSLYGGMHAYAFLRLRSLMPFQTLTGAGILAAWMSLMIVAPVLVRIAEQHNLERIALGVAWPSYCWMGTIFIFAATLAACDLARTAGMLLYRLGGATTIPAFLSPVIACETALLLSLAAGAYAFCEARQIRTEYVVIPTGKLPRDAGRIRVVQISDIHVGLLSDESRLNAILAAIRAAAPDILVSTGDLVDGRLGREKEITHHDRFACQLAAIPTPAGKYAVTGNHEFYAGLAQALAFTRAAGFTLLRNQSVAVPCGITISGIDDPAGSGPGDTPPGLPESHLLQAAPTERFHILLRHRPLVPAGSDGSFDLQLSGHVHNGQIFPFNLLVKLQFPLPCGTSSTPGHSMIHISRGTGTWGPPMRLFAPPEVTVIDIVPAKSP
jgi:predicted MPP superfamily phosphohydrolase